MNGSPQKRVRRRIAILALIFLLWLAGLIFRLIQVQVIDHSRLKAIVLKQNQNKDIILPKRGTIYDRNGNILVCSLPVPSVYFCPFEDEPFQSQIEKIYKLEQVLNLSQKEMERIKTKIYKKDHFIWIKRKIDPQQAKRVIGLRIQGILFEEENKRFYPHGKLAAHVLGGVGIDQDGLSGIELKYESKLRGKKGKRLILRDAKKREYHFEILEEPKTGKDLILSIDETFQYIAEKELEKTVLEHRASWGTVIIVQPATGEILAMANYPSYDLNNFPPSPLELARNKAIHYNFEPGSTFKIITALAALEAERVDLNDTFDCSEGVINLAGRTIRDHKKFGLLSLTEVIQYSSNVGAIRIGQRLEERFFYTTIKNLGFGHKTGIDLPAEEKGIFRDLDNWSKISPASLSIGQEISVTAIQLLQAINTIANRGLITNPKIVKKILISPDEARERPVHYRRLLSKATASTMVKILESVVEKGTGMSAQIKGYKIAGKTGTAQKFDSSIGAYSATLHTSSFIGFVPVDNPAFSMVVVIDEPKGQYYGGEVAAPLFRKIAQRLLLYLRIPPKKESPKPLITVKLVKESIR